MLTRWIPILIFVMLYVPPLSAQSRNLPNDICVDGTVTPIETKIITEMQAISEVNPFVLMQPSPQCHYVIALFKVATNLDGERHFVAWDLTTGERPFEYLRPRTTNTDMPVFHWNADETEVVVGTVREDGNFGYWAEWVTYPFHLWKIDTSEVYELRCGVDECLAPLFRQVVWDDTRNWLWTWGYSGAVAYDRNSGFVTNSYPNPPWDWGYAQRYGHRFFFSDDMSHIIVYFSVNSAAGVTVWDIEQHRAYPIPVNYLGPYAPIALSPNNRYLAVGGLAIRVWDLQNLEPIYEDRLPIYRHEGPPSPQSPIQKLRFVSNSVIETYSVNDGIQRWDLHTGELIESDTTEG